MATSRKMFSLLAVLAFAAAGMTLGGAHAAPANDDFANATTIASLPFQDLETATNLGATREAGEPDRCNSGGSSIWYTYTPAADERVQTWIASASGFPAAVGVYTGDSVDALTPVSCGTTSYFVARAGTTYRIAAGSYDGEGDLRIQLHHNAPAPPGCAGCPTFTNYEVPRDRFAYRAGETSIGVNPRTNTAMFLELSHVMRAKWDANDDVTWSESTTTPYKQTNDPILWTDTTLGRTYVAQLIANVGSVVFYTDDDGETWTLSEPAIVEPSWDHQTLGTAAYPLGLNNPAASRAVYYCAQSGAALSQCTRSDDGGRTWGPPIPMNVLACVGLHGHVIGDARGNIFIPHRECGTTQGIVTSSNAGLTWSTITVPGTLPSVSDPKLAIDAAGRMYFAATSGGHPVVSTSDDGGKTWSAPFDVGAGDGVQNTEFPMIVAGDAGRAAFAFYGARTEGNDQSAEFVDSWDLYVSFTYDGGAHWQTVDVTPNDPVQRGCIWLTGGANPCRNLLDFQDMTMDANGRVLVGYADGCLTELCRSIYGLSVDSHESVGVIARQTTGKGLLAAYDGTF
jgi:hypothetical protein